MLYNVFYAKRVEKNNYIIKQFYNLLTCWFKLYNK